MPKYYPRIYIPSFTVLNTCHALLITTVINAGVHWLTPLRKPLFKSYVFRLHSERTLSDTGFEMLFGVGVKSKPAMSQQCHVCIFEDQSKILLPVILKSCVGISYRGLRKWALVVLSMHYYSVLFSSAHACVHERTKAIKSHLNERLMHGQNYWGLYYSLHKSAQIFFWFHLSLSP